jgi:hypothetical protein
VNNSNSAQTSQPNRSNNFGGVNAGNNISDPNLLDSQFLSGGGGYQSGNGSNTQNENIQSLNANGSQLGAQSEHNQVFEKILSEVIHVSTFDHRTSNVMGMVGGSAYQNDGMMVNQVQEMPFKMRALQEPQLNKQQFTLPDGVPAPLSVLAAQPPFLDDINLINSVAFEANNCINNYSLAVPENVAFDFKPVNL